MSPDRNLLFGILALQSNLVTREQLIEAMNAWVLARHRPLGELLRERKALGEDDVALIEALLDRQLARHLGDAERGMRALELSSSAYEALTAVPDPDVQASLARLRGPDPAQPPLGSPPASQPPRYRVLRPHARGGLGEVFVAEDVELHRQVALKEIQQHRASDAASRGRFLLEAEITGRLEHPGIVPVYGLGTYADGRPFYAMRFVRGDNLRSAIERFHASKAGFDSVDFRQLLRRFLDVCNAVAFAHSRGVLHRDLKPGNVMLGEFGETLVVDWGLAKVVGRADPSCGEATLQPSSGSAVGTVAGAALGTPAYASPEQAEGRLDALGPATDVYSLGATLYCLLTGRPPVPEGPMAEALEKVRRGDVAPPGALRHDVPRPLDAVCRKAMSVSPADRYPSALALAQDVERWLADEPVSAHRDPLAVRLGRWARKRRTWVISGAAVLVVTLAALSVGLVVVGRLNGRLEQANVSLERSNKDLDAALAQAERKRKTVLAVNDFMQHDLLGQADVGNQAGGQGQERDPNLTVAVLLDRAAANVAGKFADQPETEAEIRLTIGEAYRGLGKYDQARPHLERARALRQTLLGADHPDTLTVLDRLALLDQDQGHYEKAEEALRDVLRRREAALDPDHQDVLLSKNNLATLYDAMGKYDLAEPLRLEILRRQEKIYGPDHPDVLTSKHNLASLHENQGRVEKAEALYRDVIRRREKVLGADHPATLMSKSNLAVVFEYQRRYEEAERLNVEVLKLREKALGADHPHTLMSKHNLASVTENQGKFREAERMYLELIALREKKLGPDHHFTLLSKNNLVTVYVYLGEYQKAAELNAEILRLSEKKLGPDHPMTLNVKHNRAALFERLGKDDEAEAAYLEVISLREKKLGPDHRHTVLSKRNLAAVYVRRGKNDRAEPLLRQLLVVVKAQAGAESAAASGVMAELGMSLLAQKKFPDAEVMLRDCVRIRQKTQPEAWTTFNAQSLLGEALLGQTKYGEAEPMLVKSYEGMQQRQEAIPPPFRGVRLKEALGRLVRLYEATGKNEEAAKWRKLGEQIGDKK